MIESRSNSAEPGPQAKNQCLRQPPPNKSMRLITLYVSPYYLERLDQLVTAGIYPNRSEAIRFAIRDMTRQEAP